MVNYILADVVSSVRVGYCGSFVVVRVYSSAFALVILEVLYSNGCIVVYSIVGLWSIDIYLKYYACASVLSGINVVSTPGVSFYSSLQFLRFFNYSFSGFLIVSTSNGVLTTTEIFLFKGSISGEVLLKVEL